MLSIESSEAPQADASVFMELLVGKKDSSKSEKQSKQKLDASKKGNLLSFPKKISETIQNSLPKELKKLLKSETPSGSKEESKQVESSKLSFFSSSKKQVSTEKKEKEVPETKKDLKQISTKDWIESPNIKPIPQKFEKSDLEVLHASKKEDLQNEQAFSRKEQKSFSIKPVLKKETSNEDLLKKISEKAVDLRPEEQSKLLQTKKGNRNSSESFEDRFSGKEKTSLKSTELFTLIKNPEPVAEPNNVKFQNLDSSEKTNSQFSLLQLKSIEQKEESAKEFKFIEQAKTPEKPNLEANKAMFQDLVSSLKFQILESGKNTAEIQLYPKELGKMRLTLTQEGNNIVGKVVVESEEAKAMFGNGFDNLKEELRKEGFFVTSFQVNVDVNHGNSREADGSSEIPFQTAFGNREFEKTNVEVSNLSYSSHDGNLDLWV